MATSLVKKLWYPVIWLALLVVSLPSVWGAVPTVQALAPITQGISSPLRIAIDAEGYFYVTDSAACAVLKLDSYGRVVATFKTPLPPQGIAVTANGSLVVTQGDAAVVLDSAGKEIGRLGQGAGQFKRANGIAIDDNGYIYVVDTGAHCVQVFTASGQYSKRFGVLGSLAGQFNGPTGIAYEKISKQIVVADSFNARLQFFDTVNHTWKRTIGSLGATALKFTSPQGISFEYITDKVTGTVTTRMYVVDAFQSCVQAIELGATPLFLAFIGNYGYRNGQLVVPPDLVFDPANKRLIVANGAGNLTVYGIDGGSNPSLDTTPPALTVEPLPALTDTATVTVSGTAEEGAAITLNADSAVTVSSVSYTSSTTWYATVTNLVPGANTITVTATDAAGNTSRQSVTTTYEIPAPALTINVLPEYASSKELVLSGTVDAGAFVAVSSEPAGVIAPVAYPAAGTWEARVTDLANGAATFTVTAQKQFSKLAVVSAVTTVDTIPPVVGVSSPASGSYVDAETVTVTGTVGDSNLNRVAINGSAAAVGDGIYQGTVTVAAGVNTIQVVATDLAGNIAAQTLTVTFELPAPLLAVAPLPAYTNAGGIVISGTVDAEAVVAVTADNATVAAVTYPTAGTWQATVTPVIDGKVTVTASAKKPYSKVALATAETVFDRSAPLVAVSALADGSYTGTQTQNITGTVADTNLDSVTINGQAIAVVDGTFSSAVTLVAGANSITVVATDLAGNITSDSRTLAFDNSVPVIGVSTPADGLFTNRSVVTVTGSVAEKVAPLQTVTVAGVPAVVDGFNWSAAVNLNDGLNTIDIVAADLAGNVAGAKRTVTLDLSRPEIAIAVPGEDMATNAAAVTVSGTVSDQSGVIVTAALNGNGIPVSVAGGTFNLTADLAEEGTYAVTVNAVDGAGNSSTATRTVIYDKTPPQVAVNLPRPGQLNLLTGSVEAGSMISFSDQKGSVDAAVVVDGTMWSADFSQVNYNPATLAVTAVDAAGNKTTTLVRDQLLAGAVQTVKQAVR